MTLVVPVYRELRNSNVVRFLKAIRAQDLPHSLIEVLFVVNNNPEVASESAKSSIYRENQATIQFLRGLHEDFKVEIVDRSTDGIETNMGLIRHLGLQKAIESPTVNPADHVLINMDADTTFDLNYLSGLYSLYSFYDVDSVITQLEHRLDPEADDLSLRTFHQYALNFSKHRIWQAMTYARGGVGTPQITLRASAYQRIGGIPQIVSNEDYEFTKRISRNLTYYYSSGISVYTQDRARLDGFDAQKRARWNANLVDQCPDQAESHCDWARNIFLLNLKLMDSIDARFSSGQIHRDEALDEFVKHAVGSDGSPLFGQSPIHVELDYVPNSHVLSPFEDYITPLTPYGGQILFNWVSENLPSRDRDALLYRYWVESSRHDRLRDEREKLVRLFLHTDLSKMHPLCTSLSSAPFIRALCTPHSQLQLRILSLKRGYSSDHEVLNRLATFYPDWLNEFWRTPYRRDHFSYLQVTRLMVEAHNDPSAMPLISAFYRKIRH